MSDKFIPLSVPNFKGNESKYVNMAIDSEWVSTGGKFILDFEKNISEYVNTSEAVACQSGTAGIHLALIAAGVDYGDEVIVPALTFIATVNPVKYIGAQPVFMDCDDSLCIDADKLEDFCETRCEFKDNILYNKKTNAPIKAVIAVHIFGNMVNMEKIISLCRRYNLVIIEDATEALGSYYIDGKYKGMHAGTIGDIGIYSFNGNKIITTGGGGMVVGKDEYIKKIRHLSTQAKKDPENFIHDEIGYNYRMTNLQAALGVAQLEQLENFIKIKKENYDLYKSEFKNSDFYILDFNSDIRPNYWFYSLNVDRTPFSKEDIINHLKANNIQARPIWGLIHEQSPYIKNQSYKIDKANYYFKNIVNIPCSSNLSKDDVLMIADIIKNI